MCGRYRLSRRKQLVEEYFDASSGGEEWSPRYNIAPTQPCPGHPPEPERTHPRTVVSSLGIDSIMGKGLVRSCPNDQCEIGNSGNEACVQRCVEIPQVPDPRRRLLRVGENRESQATLLL